MNKNLVYVGGSKGGTGKSLVCMALIHYFRKHFEGENILLIETDTSNPDVGRLYEKTKGVTVKPLALSENENGWTDLIDTIDESSERIQHVVINSMAASNLGIEAQGRLLDKAIKENILNFDFKAFWVMNRNKDSVELLKDFLDCMETAVVYPVKNLFFGNEKDFVFYEDSPQGEAAREMIAERGGFAFTFPNLNDVIADLMYTDEVNIESLPTLLKAGRRMALDRWIGDVKISFDEIFR
jgi:hypothetical protein